MKDLSEKELQLLRDFLFSCAYSGEKFELTNTILITVKARDIIEQLNLKTATP